MQVGDCYCDEREYRSFICGVAILRIFGQTDRLETYIWSAFRFNNFDIFLDHIQDTNLKNDQAPKRPSFSLFKMPGLRLVIVTAFCASLAIYVAYTYL